MFKLTITLAEGIKITRTGTLAEIERQRDEILDSEADAVEFVEVRRAA